jgi:hypothetical protein
MSSKPARKENQLRKVLVRLLRQSPAMVVAMLALFVALTGTAVATTSALITGNQIKNSSITGADVKNKSLTPRDFRGSVRGPRGLRGLTGATGTAGGAGAKGDKGDKGDPGPQGRWAHVHGDGTIVAQSGGITVIHGGAGFWFVTFPGADVLNKPILASESRLDGTFPPGAISATPCGGGAQGLTCTQSDNANTVLVNRTNPTGTLADSAFYVMVVP